MKIFLTGFMGCGKSTLARKLAVKMAFPCIDLDKEIEKKTGISITNYFQIYGEDDFRQVESETLQKNHYPENVVLATGGGTPCFFDNMDWMNKTGITVYLSMSPEALAHRLKTERDKRPLIQRLNETDLVQYITDKLAEREAFYKQAKYILQGINLTAEKILTALAADLKLIN